MFKATFTLLTGNKAWVSQYIGTLESPRALAAERRSVAHFVDLFGLEPEVVVLDKHPLYPSRLLAADFPHCQVLEVQHHRAHLAALLAENGDPGPIIGMTMDGTGYGDDGRIWGGEFFVGDLRQLRRAGHLRYLFLPGGDQGVRQAWRFALSLLYELFGDTAPTRRWAGRFGRRGEAVLEAVARRQAGVLTSSCGRLFDGAAALLGLGQHNGYDGQLPMLLQARAERSRAGIPAYGFSLRREQSLLVLDFLPALAEMLDDRRPVADKAWGFQRTLADGFLATAKRLRQECGIAKVGLSGGVFQNLLLLRLTVQRLEENGFQVLLHRRLPANDGCISLGQAALAAQTVV